MQWSLRRHIATLPIARGAALPLRTMIVARYDAHLIGRSVDWLVHSRETTNLTYDLDSLNRDQLSDWAERNGRHYLFFKEQPLDHWWPGDGIGAAWTGR